MVLSIQFDDFQCSRNTRNRQNAIRVQGKWARVILLWDPSCRQTPPQLLSAKINCPDGGDDAVTCAHIHTNTSSLNTHARTHALAFNNNCIVVVIKSYEPPRQLLFHRLHAAFWNVCVPLMLFSTKATAIDYPGRTIMPLKRRTWHLWPPVNVPCTFYSTKNVFYTEIRIRTRGCSISALGR